MQFTVTKGQLDEPLKMAASATTKSASHPIFSHVLIQADEAGNLRLTGSDGSTEIVTYAQADIGTEGGIAVPAHKLRDICGSMQSNDASISFSLEGHQMSVVSGKSRFKIQTLPADHFPNIDQDEYTLVREVPQRDLKALFESTTSAMASKDVRYYLNGMCLNFRGENLEAVATDGHRLNVDEIQTGQPDATAYGLSATLADASLAKADGRAIVPRDFVLSLNRMLANSDDPALLLVSQRHFQVRRGSTVYTSKLIEGNFPDYNRIMPQRNDTPVVADTQALRKALDRIKVVSDDTIHGARVTLEGDTLRLQANNKDQEEASEPVPVAYQGPEITLGFNILYLIDALKACPSEQVQIHIQDERSSALVAPHDVASNVRCVVMPMRL